MVEVAFDYESVTNQILVNNKRVYHDLSCPRYDFQSLTDHKNGYIKIFIKI